MLQVLTNSSTCFGTSEIWVSRSLQWMTLTPIFCARTLNLPVDNQLGDFLRLPALEFLVGEQTLADVNQALLGEMRDEAGIGRHVQ